MKKIFVVIAVVLAVFAGQAQAQTTAPAQVTTSAQGSAQAKATTWEFDATHSTVGFGVRHMMVSTVRGSFPKFAGSFQVTGSDPTTAVFKVDIDVTSIDTRDAKRDEDLKSPDFFDVAKFPTMTFTSRKVVKVGDGKLRITGDLTLKGISKEVVLDVEGPTAEVKDPWGMIRVGAQATAKINRKEFGLTWSKALETGGLVVGDEVTITLDIELVKKG